MTGANAKIKRIYVGESLVRPKWKPNANTLMYLPLESNGNDYSGNGNNLTWSGGTPTYTISGGTKTVASLNGSTLGRISTLSGTISDYTINVWCKPTSTGTWQEIFDHNNYASSLDRDNVYLSFNGTSQAGPYIDFGYQYRPNGGTAAYQQIYGTTNRSANTWYNVCVASTSSGVKLYVNGIQIGSNSITGAIVLTGGNSAVGGRWFKSSGTNTNYFKGYMSEFIFELTTWDLAQIKQYYNYTKSNYGL